MKAATAIGAGWAVCKFLPTPHGGGGDSEGKTSFRDFDEHILQAASWETPFGLMEAIVFFFCRYISRCVSLLLVDTPNVHKVGGCGKKVFMREVKALSKEGTVSFLT